MKQVIGYSWTQPHMPYGNEKDDCPVVPRIPYRLNDAPEEKPMRHDSFALVYLQLGQDVKFSPHALVACSAERCYTHTNRIERNAPAQRKLPGAWVTSWRLATMNNSSLPHSQNQPIDDPQPNFDAPRLIQRVDALCYSLPMTAPDGTRCFVTLVGSFAAWGETMRALVREGFVAQDESGWKLEPGAGKGGAK